MANAKTFLWRETQMEEKVPLAMRLVGALLGALCSSPVSRGLAKFHFSFLGMIHANMTVANVLKQPIK